MESGNARKDQNWTTLGLWGVTVTGRWWCWPWMGREAEERLVVSAGDREELVHCTLSSWAWGASRGQRTWRRAAWASCLGYQGRRSSSAVLGNSHVNSSKQRAFPSTQNQGNTECFLLPQCSQILISARQMDKCRCRWITSCQKGGSSHCRHSGWQWQSELLGEPGAVVWVTFGHSLRDTGTHCSIFYDIYPVVGWGFFTPKQTPANQTQSTGGWQGALSIWMWGPCRGSTGVGKRDIQMSDANDRFKFWLCQDPLGVLLQVKNRGKRSSTTGLAWESKHDFKRWGVFTSTTRASAHSNPVAFKYLGLLKTVSSPTCANTDIKPNSIYLA